MIVGTILMVMAVAALVVALAFSVQDLRARGADPKVRDRAIGAFFVSFGAAASALILLALSFLVGEVTIGYVWRNVDTSYAWYQRLSGLWVGREGSLLLWTVLGMSVWLLEEIRHRRALSLSTAHAARTALTAHMDQQKARSDVDALLADAEANRRVARLTLIGLSLMMLTVVALDRAFLPTDPALLQQAPGGRGVNPQLIIPLNAIHPPIIFLGYALTTLPAAFGLAHLVTGRRGWLGPARRWAQPAFLVLTLGVGLGGLWAYIALGWGGYWAWDPVEVGSILPWLATVAFLHAAFRADGRHEFPIAAPALALLMFAATMMSTMVVRAGGVWVSLHSFLGPGAAASPWQRFVDALTTTPEVQFYTVALVGSLGAMAVLSVVQVRRVETGALPAPAATRPRRASASTFDRLLGYVTLRHAFLAGVLLLTLLFTVTVTVLLLGANGFPSDGVRIAVFTERTGPVALTTVLVMGAAVAIGAVPRKVIVGLLGSSLAVGVLAALLLPDTWALAMAVPMLVAVAVLAATRIWRAFASKAPRRHAARLIGVHMIHLGVAVLLLGHGFVHTFERFEEPVQLGVGETRTAGAHTITLVALDTFDHDDNGRIDRVEATMRLATLEGKDLGLVTAGFQYYDFQAHYKPDIGIKKLGRQDLYLAPTGIHDPSQGWIFGNLPLLEQGDAEAGSVDRFSVQLNTVPYIDLVWGGAILMVLGALVVTIVTWTAMRPEDAGPTRAVQRDPRPHGATRGAVGPAGAATPTEPQDQA